MQRLPVTFNADLARGLAEIVRYTDGTTTWQALGDAISICAVLYSKWSAEQKVELLWAGPAPASAIPARRIDQVLYDLIGSAEREILLITFAAHKIHRLTQILAAAARRRVRIRLLLEFGAESKYQLSHDALEAFPQDLRAAAEVFYWPIEKRELNLFDKPGKLHAKAAVVDKKALLSSANLTDDAFLRNLELGVLFAGGDIPRRLQEHFDDLVSTGVLVRWSEPLPSGHK